VLIRKQFTFEAAHVLPFHKGKCSRLHGHSYRLEVTVTGPLREIGSDAGMVMDFGDLSTVVKREVLEKLDHQYLNEILENPTCEQILIWIAAALAPDLPNIDELVLWETESACAIIRPRLIERTETVRYASAATR
jgi:6-pyruvoyltetrahydropterin/6-carboxytetrahydropterin synthase